MFKDRFDAGQKLARVLLCAIFGIVMLEYFCFAKIQPSSAKVKKETSAKTQEASAKIKKLEVTYIISGQKDILTEGKKETSWESTSGQWVDMQDGESKWITTEAFIKGVWSAAGSGDRININYSREVRYKNALFDLPWPDKIGDKSGKLHMGLSVPADIVLGDPLIVHGSIEGSASAPYPPQGPLKVLGLMQNSNLAFIPSNSSNEVSCNFKIILTPDPSGEVKAISITTSLEVGGKKVVFEQGATHRYTSSLEVNGKPFAFLNENSKYGPTFPDFILKDNNPRMPVTITSTRERVWLDIGCVWPFVLFENDDWEQVTVGWLPAQADLGMWKCPPKELPKISADDKTSEFASIVSDYFNEMNDFKRILRKANLAGRKKQDETDEEYKERTKEQLKALDQETFDKHLVLKRLEAQYFEKAAQYYGKLDDAGIASLKTYLVDRVKLFHSAVNSGLDEMRRIDFSFSEDSNYFRYRKYYESYFSELIQLIGVSNNINQMEILRLTMMINEGLMEKYLRESSFSQKNLLADQIKLKNIYLDEAWVYLIREQIHAENALDSQDSYGSALKEARAKNLKLPWHDEFLKRQAQQAIYGTQYIMAVFGTMWSAYLDGLVHVINASSDSGPIFDTLHEKTNKQISEINKKSLNRLATIAMLKKLDVGQIVQLGKYLEGSGLSPIEEARIKDIENDRMFNEATSGGLLRLSDCFENEWGEKLEAEYRIALKHGKLSYAEMRKTLNLREGREESGNDPTLKRMIDPMGSIKTIAAQYIGKQYDGAEDYLAERNGQLMEMDGLLLKLKKINFNLDYLEANLHLNYQVHYALSQNNPDYMAFMQKYYTFENCQKEIALRKAMNETEDEEEKTRLSFKLDMLRKFQGADSSKDIIRILKQQLSDRIAVSDYEGTLAIAKQLEAVEPAIKERGLSNWLSQDLAWEHTKEIGINTAVSLGNNGLYSAFFARYLGPLSVQGQPVKLSNFRKVFSTWNGFSGLLQFTWGQINPFSALTAAEMNAQDMAKAIMGVTRAGIEQIEQEKIKQNVLIGYFGIDEKYADFIANSIINMQQTQFDDPTSLVNITSRNLLRRIDAYVPDKVDVPGWRKITLARQQMREYWLAVDSLAKLEQMKLELQDANRKWNWKSPTVASISKKIKEAAIKLKLAFSPLREAEITQMIGLHDAKLSAAKSKAERIAAHADLFRTLPFSALVKAKKNKHLPPALEEKIDLARRELLSQTQIDFLHEYPDLAQYIERFIYTGSGAREKWLEYKKVSSDLDFTIFLQEGVHIAVKEQIKSQFDEFFEKRASFPPEELDIHCFVDEKPKLRSTGQNLDSLLAVLSNPDANASLVAEARKNIEILLHDLGDPERYFSTGAVRFLHYLNKLGGSVKKVQGDKLINDQEYQAKLFKNVKFEDWMGMEIVLDNMKMVEQHKGGDRLDYSKNLAKYGLRILLGRLIQSKKGLAMVNNLKIDDLEKNIAQTGGLHGEFVRMAQETGLFNQQQILLFKEMNLRKHGKPLGEVFKERNGGKVLADNDPALNALLETHIAETEKFAGESIRETVVSNSLHMKKLADAITNAKDTVVKEGLELKYREILFSISEVWYKLPDTVRKSALSSVAIESEMFRALEDVRTFMDNKQAEAIRTYNPFQKSGDVPQDDQPKN